MLRELSLKAQRRRKEQSQPPQPLSSSSAATPTQQAPDQQPATQKPPSPKQSRIQSIPRRLSRGASSFHRASSLLGRPPRATPRSSDKRPPHKPAPTTSDLTASKSSTTPPQPSAPKRPFPRKPGLNAPLISVDELYRWRPTGLAAKCVSRVPLPDSAIKRYVRGQPSQSTMPHSAARGAAGSLKRLQPPRLLLCHDFQGGYPAWEANASGAFGDDCPDDPKMWRFNHWAYVDIFVYFSHHCVTIPPVGYVQAGHRHGSLVLGTLIFEWDDGLTELLKILASFKTRAKAAAQLAAIAKFYGFDGWLVNVEVGLPNGSVAASDLAAFVGDLTRAMRKIVGPVSEVIWYDSVTRDGSLSWQNELNAENEQFFKAAGSIFTNYHWDRNAPVRSAAKAGTRRTDVFTGVDVFGRNTFGGGGFHTHLALRAIKQGGTSAAIFAPGWTVEKCPPNADPRELEERFWTGPKGKFGREAVSQFFKERAVLTDLPFSTNFDPGWGPRTMRNGVVKDERRYFNMAQQQVQPSFIRTSVAAGDTNAANLSLSHDEALNGSASIKTEFAFSDSRMVSGTYSVLRLFVANVSFPAVMPSRLPQSREGGLKLSYTYYAQTADGSEAAADDFGLLLHFACPPSAVMLVGSESKWIVQSGPGAARRINPRIQILGKFVNFQVVAPVTERQVYGATKPTDGSPGWRVRSFLLDPTIISGQRLSEVMIVVGRPVQHSISVRPSPLMSAAASRGASRMSSRVGSRVGSRVVSRSNSPPRAGESRFDEQKEPGSWAHGIRQLSNGYLDGPQSSSQSRLTDGKEDQPDDFGGGLLKQYRESFGQRSRSEYASHLTTRQTEERQVLSQRTDERPPALVFSRRVGSDTASSVGNTGSLARPRIGERRELMEGGRRGLSSRLPPKPASYANNFDVDGSIDFGHMEQEDSGLYSANTSRAVSRLGSRLATPSGSRPLSRLGSIAPSASNSRAASVINSRRTSRIASPSATPLGSSSMGALPTGSTFSRDLSNRFMASSSSRLALESGAATPLRGSAPLSDLKSALMVAAGSMAGEPVSLPGSSSDKLNIVYLGELSIDVDHPADLPKPQHLRNVREV